MEKTICLNTERTLTTFPTSKTKNKIVKDPHLREKILWQTVQEKWTITGTKTKILEIYYCCLLAMPHSILSVRNFTNYCGHWYILVVEEWCADSPLLVVSEGDDDTDGISPSSWA